MGKRHQEGMEVCSYTRHAFSLSCTHIHTCPHTHTGSGPVLKIKRPSNNSSLSGVAQRKLVLRHQPKKSKLLPRPHLLPVTPLTVPFQHSTEPSQPIRKPLPQASKTSLYDEHWAAKQERGTSESGHLWFILNSPSMLSYRSLCQVVELYSSSSG